MIHPCALCGYSFVWMQKQEQRQYFVLLGQHIADNSIEIFTLKTILIEPRKHSMMMITQYFVLLDQHLADKSHWQGRHPICNLKQFHIVFANVTDGWFFLSFVRFWLIRAHLTCPKQYGVVVRIRCKPPQRVIIGLSNWSIRRWWWWGGGWWWCIAMSGLTTRRCCRI